MNLVDIIKKLNYSDYCRANAINELFSINIDNNFKINSKVEKGLYETVDPENKNPFPAELDDLVRLHYLIRARKVTTIMEFGVGKSTLVLADALKKNKADYEGYVKSHLRRSNPFEIHSIDNSGEWIERCKKDFPHDLLKFVHFHCSEAEMTTFNGRACTMYKSLPNICPDFIYLDAPDQFSVLNDIRGISTRTVDRLPMAADILLIEPFLLPGTLIVVDGRTANSRFLKNNLQREWEYSHFAQEDIHTFELVEKPLGKINQLQIEFCLNN